MKFLLNYSSAYGTSLSTVLDGIKHVMDQTSKTGFHRHLVRLQAFDRVCERCGEPSPTTEATFSQKLMYVGKLRNANINVIRCASPDTCYRMAVKVTFPTNDGEEMYFIS